MDNFTYSVARCPEHPEEDLKIITLGIQTPNLPEGMEYPIFDYCPTSKKILYEGKLINIKEYALNMINSMYHKNYKLKDIKVTLDPSKLVGKIEN
jgi:hypothetical protein